MTTPNDNKALLDTFPHTRPVLPSAYQKIYLEEIRVNRGEKGGLFYSLLGWLEGWMHCQIRCPTDTVSVLEIGAGTLNHMPYEPAAARYDIVEPMPALYADSPNKGRVVTAYADIAEAPLEPTYGRIVSTAAFEHIEDLPNCVARSGLLLTEGGRLQVSIPSEGGFLWGISWRLTTGILFKRRTGLDYSVLMRYEHINTADDIIGVIGHFFERVAIRRFPLPLRHLSFYTYIEATGQRRDLCQAYLESCSTP